MPNLVTHAYITTEVFPMATPDMIMGSTLPDFAGMFKDYRASTFLLSQYALTSELKQGIGFHTATDQVFDLLPLRNQLLADCRSDSARQLPLLDKKVAGVLANIGTDILMDVPILENQKGQNIYDDLKIAVLSGRTALAETFTPSFTELVQRFFATDRPYQYRDTTWLTEMLQRRFYKRNPRLSFPDELCSGVADMLQRQLGRIRQHSQVLLTQTIDTLK
ncbi:MAG: hypothetical protein JWS12_687 [Candidatus Saccharibacteria bacterium]|nr:hypothetical protein [Candidatus Saccharibacteria bacterium]